MIAVRFLDIGLDACWQRRAERRWSRISRSSCENRCTGDGNNGQNALHGRSFLSPVRDEDRTLKEGNRSAKQTLQCRSKNE